MVKAFPLIATLAWTLSAMAADEEVAPVLMPRECFVSAILGIDMIRNQLIPALPKLKNLAANLPEAVILRGIQAKPYVFSQSIDDRIAAMVPSEMIQYKDGVFADAPKRALAASKIPEATLTEIRAILETAQPPYITACVATLKTLPPKCLWNAYSSGNKLQACLRSAKFSEADIQAYLKKRLDMWGSYNSAWRDYMVREKKSL